ncbi:MAG: acyl carrier protein [Pseudomonadota bacterium]
MKISEFLLLLEDIVEAEPGTIKETDMLTDFEGWDSMAMLGFIAMLDEHFGLIVPPEKISKAKAVTDLMALLDGNLTKSDPLDGDPS